MNASTLSRSVARLKARGWLKVEPSGDGRILNIDTTHESLEKIAEIYPGWQKAQDRAQAALGE